MKSAKIKRKDLIILQPKNIIIDYRARGWCKLPYPDHRLGCPNYGKRKTCPPRAPLFEKIVKSPFVLVAVKFNLARHIKQMKARHPDWSDRQAKCVLYWQGKVNKYLKDICEGIKSTIPNSVILNKPEAHGVHVFETCRKNGLILEGNPKRIVWKISIIGIKK